MKDQPQDSSVFPSDPGKRNGITAFVRVGNRASRLRMVRANGPVGNEHRRMLRVEVATKPRLFHTPTALENALERYHRGQNV